MNRLQNRFRTKLHLMAVGLLVVVVLLAGVFYASADRYQYHLERSELAHTVLLSYLAVSNQTYRKLSAMGEIVEQGRIDDLQERLDSERSLRDALAEVRQNITAEVAFVRDEEEAEELQHLVEIESLVETVISAAGDIRQYVENGEIATAADALSALRSDAIAGQFSKLIGMALEEERREVSETQAAANRLDRMISTVLPISLIGIVTIGLYMVVTTSRRLSRSVDALRDAASAYTSGEFDYRMEALAEQEFSHLREVMHRMAEELFARRAVAEQDKSTLESLISERTRELEQSNTQLERLDRSRRQLLADISHELRTPLTVIQGESEMALRGDPKPIEEYQDALTRVREQAMHTNRLVDDLLFVARSEEGHARLKKRSVSLADILKSVSDDFHVAANKKCISITENYSDEGIVVSGDARRLRQVFAILLDNAFRYSRSAGSIRITLEGGVEAVIVTVEDNGIGLSETDAEQAFHRFYRGGNAERHSEGAGLGLPVAKAIVEAHGGSISLTGTPGKGALARVVLPVEGEIRAIA